MPVSPDTTTPPTLYGGPRTRALRCLWMLRELSIDARIVPVALGQARDHPALRALNPNGTVPVLVDGETRVWESLAINLYLADRSPGPLSPRDLHERAAVLQWSFWAAAHCDGAAARVFGLDAQARRDPRRQPALDAAIAALGNAAAVLDSVLADRPYLAAPRFTVADLNVAAVLLPALARPQWLAGRTALRAWLSGALARPAIRALLAEHLPDGASIAASLPDS